MERRDFIAGSFALAALAGAASAEASPARYGRIGRITATPGQRGALITILLEGTGHMPGCLSYIVAKDATDPNALWITEVWDSEASHSASLALPQVRAAIAKGRPLIANMDKGIVTEPVGGQGLPR